MEISMEFPQETKKKRTIISSSNPTSEYTSKEKEIIILKEHLY